MASTDFPFSVTSKFIDASGAEHLVTVRAATVQDFANRLTQASTVFPYAGFAAPAAPRTPASSPAPAPEAPAPTPIRTPSQQAPHCTTHNRPMTRSKWGGWYCPAKTDDGYCQEKSA